MVFDSFMVVPFKGKVEREKFNRITSGAAARVLPASIRLKVGYASELVVCALHSPACPR